jgi:hypothetical protein
MLLEVGRHYREFQKLETTVSSASQNLRGAVLAQADS